MNIRIPNSNKNEMFAIAEEFFGGSRVQVICQDGKTRMARIKGTMKFSFWIRKGDLLIIRLWEFQDDKADIIWRYTRTDVNHLKEEGLLPKIIGDIYEKEKDNKIY